MRTMRAMLRRTPPHHCLIHRQQHRGMLRRTLRKREGWSGRARAAALLLLLAALPYTAAHAQQIARVTLDTASLRGLGTYHVYFQLSDGSFTGNGNSQAVVSDFLLTGGALASSPPAVSFGSVTGSLAAGTLTLRDSDPATGGLADYLQAFTVTEAASLIRFDLTLSATSRDFPFTDAFAFTLLGANLEPLSTDAPAGFELVRATFDAPSPVPTGHSTLSGPPLKAIVTLRENPAEVPEPSAGALMGAGLAAAGLAFRLLGRANARPKNRSRGRTTAGRNAKRAAESSGS